MEHLYPEVETSDIRDKVDLLRYSREYEHLHKCEPFALLTGPMQDSTGTTVHCYRYLITDCKGKKFTVALPDGYATLTVPEHERVVITLTTILDEE